MEKILFVVKGREFGGLEVVLLDWLSQIDYTKVAVAVCSYGTDALWKKLADSGWPVEAIHLTIPDTHLSWKTIPQWLRLFRTIRPGKVIFLEAVASELDVIPVLAARCSNCGPLFLFEANWGRCPEPAEGGAQKLHFGFLPGIGLYRYKEMLRQKFRGKLANHTFVVSETIKNNLVKYYGYPATRTSVLYHGVDICRFQPSPMDRLQYRTACEIPEDAIVIVSHGRLVARKRVERILEAFEALSGEHPRLWVLLTCYGPVKETIEKLAGQSRASGRITLVEFQNDTSKLLKASDIYVLASDDEGFGIALVEALSTGLLCVATEGPGPRDIIKNGENGFLVEPSSAGVLLGLRQALKLNMDKRGQIVRQARESVIERFEIGAAIRTALDAFEIPRVPVDVAAHGQGLL